MLTQFMTNWFSESKKWTTGVLKVAAAESPENAQVLTEWVNHWSDRAVSALLPIVNSVLDERVDEMVSEELDAFRVRITKTGIAL